MVQAVYKKLVRCGPHSIQPSLPLQYHQLHATTTDYCLPTPCRNLLVLALTVSNRFCPYIISCMQRPLIIACRLRVETCSFWSSVSNRLCPHNTISCLQRLLVFRSVWKGSGRCRG